MKLKLKENEITYLSENEDKLHDKIEENITEFDSNIILFEMLKINPK